MKFFNEIKTPADPKQGGGFVGKTPANDLPQKLENDLPQFSTDGVIKFWSFKLHEDEWLEARLRAKTQHQKFLDWAKNNFKK